MLAWAEYVSANRNDMAIPTKQMHTASRLMSVRVLRPIRSTKSNPREEPKKLQKETATESQMASVLLEKPANLRIVVE